MQKRAIDRCSYIQGNWSCLTVLELNRLQFTQKIFVCYQTEPRHSAHSFFLPAWILPTSFSSFVGLPPNSLAFRFPSRSFGLDLLCFPIDWECRSAMASAAACDNVVSSLQNFFFFFVDR